MGYWKSKVVPTMKKLFERSPTKKDVVVEASKSLTFDESKVFRSIDYNYVIICM